MISKTEREAHSLKAARESPPADFSLDGLWSQRRSQQAVLLMIRNPTRGQMLGEQVAEVLLKQIISGTYSPGAPLPTEYELAQRQGVSRLTLREAIGILRQKGIIEVRRGRGTFVRPHADWSPFDPLVLGARAFDREDDLQSMERLLEARRIVETGVAELAAKRRVPADLAVMTAEVEKMRQAGRDVDRFVEGDLGFHDALLAATKNPVIEVLFAPLRELLHAHRRSTSHLGRDRAQAIRSHLSILDAVTAGDSDAARMAMAEHLRLTEAGIRRARAREEYSSVTAKSPSS